MSVDTAAPVTPSAGMGPNPKIRIGSRIRLIRFEIQRMRIATAASPAPRNMALFKNNSTREMLPPNATAV